MVSAIDKMFFLDAFLQTVGIKELAHSARTALKRLKR
jgi:hypothetical protein